MGQYYKIVNVKKRQYLNPHMFNDGMKLMEFGMSASGTLTALAVLLADGNGRGGGDLNSDNPIIGSWAGDPIVVAGDYADQGKFLPADKSEETLYSVCEDEGEDISAKGSTAIDEILFVAKESEHPRAFEVASNFIKNMSELNKDLLQLSKTKKEIEKDLNTPNVHQISVRSLRHQGQLDESTDRALSRVGPGKSRRRRFRMGKPDRKVIAY